MKVVHCHFPRVPRILPLAAILLGILAVTGCRQGVPLVDTAPKPLEAHGTISGTVRGPEGTSAVEGRAVEVVNLDTNERQRTLTNSTGGFSFKLSPGKYRVEVQLRDGETLLKRPGVIDLNRSDIDAHADFVLGSARLVRPRYPVLRGDDGLGSAIA